MAVDFLRCSLDQALGSVPSGVIVPILVVLLLASAWKLWQHARPSSKR